MIQKNNLVLQERLKQFDLMVSFLQFGIKLVLPFQFYSMQMLQ